MDIDNIKHDDNKCLARNEVTCSTNEVTKTETSSENTTGSNHLDIK